MELLPTSDDYDKVTHQVRRFSTQRLLEMIEALRPFVSEVLQDPEGVHDLEASRVVAYTGLLKLQASLIKDLGALYRVGEKPAPEGEETLPASTVARMLQDAAELHEQQLQEAVAAAEVRTREAVATERQLSLQAAQSQVLGSLERLRAR